MIWLNQQFQKYKQFVKNEVSLELGPVFHSRTKLKRHYQGAHEL